MPSKKDESNNKPEKLEKSGAIETGTKARSKNKSFASLFILILTTWAFIGYDFLYHRPQSEENKNQTNKDTSNNFMLITKLENKIYSLEEEVNFINENLIKQSDTKESPKEEKDEIQNEDSTKANPEIEKDVNIYPEDDNVKQQNVDILNKNINDPNIKTSNNDGNSDSTTSKLPDEKQIVLFDIELANQQFEEIINEQQNINTDISQFSNRTTELESSLEEVFKEIGETKLKERSVNLIVAAIDLQKSVQEARDYSRELNILKRLSGENGALIENIKTLEKDAGNGIANFEDIKSKFSQVTKEIINSKKKNIENPNFIDTALMKLSDIVSIRKIDANQDSNKAEDVFARAYKHLLDNDLKKAIIELDKIDNLSEKQKSKIQIWTQTAKNNINSNEAAQNILDYTLKPKKSEAGK